MQARARTARAGASRAHTTRARTARAGASRAHTARARTARAGASRAHTGASCTGGYSGSGTCARTPGINLGVRRWRQLVRRWRW
ncbi:hypothetical protein, partial [Micromonospora sp. CPCC 205558]|uniref:hypothetical protein n=1 Tax=Micromonospora sp. CPCC 205558 TaxID=3122403 RepID=UPI002FF34D8F